MIIKLIHALAALLFIAAQIYILPKVIDTADGLDFRLIWLAGEVWAEGGNPYGPAFGDAYATAFGAGPVSHFWVYPPYWYPVSRLAAGLPFEDALIVWNVISYSLILIGSACLAATIPLAARYSSLASRAALFAALASVAMLMQSTPFAISIGQTSMLLFGGLSIFVIGVVRTNRIAVAISLALLMMKPNAGLVTVAACLALRWTWPALLACGLVLGVWLAAALMASGPMETFAAFLANLARYNDPQVIASTPQNLTGLLNLGFVTGLDLAQGTVLAAAYSLAFLAAVLLRERLALSFVIVALMAAFIPLHTYDLTFWLAAVPGISASAGYVAVPAGAAFLLVFRAGNLGGLIEPDLGHRVIFNGSLLASFAGVLLLVASILNAVHASTDRLADE